jgi:hypothetical protein
VTGAFFIGSITRRKLCVSIEFSTDPKCIVTSKVFAHHHAFLANAQSLQNDFIAEGEQHYWVHVAIDRFTGEVLDKQIEVVNE